MSEDLLEDDDSATQQSSVAAFITLPGKALASGRKHRQLERFEENFSLPSSYEFSSLRFDFSPECDGPRRSDDSPDIALILEKIREKGQGSTQGPDVTPSVAPDVTSAPNVSPASSVASDIPPDIPPDVTIGLDNNVRDAPSSSPDVASETVTDVTTESDNSTVIDVNQSSSITNAPLKALSNTSTIAPPGQPNNVMRKMAKNNAGKDEDPAAVLNWQWDVVTINPTPPVKSNEQSSPSEIIQGETEEF